MPRLRLSAKSSIVSLMTLLLIAACGGSGGADIDKGNDDGKGTDDGNGNGDDDGDDPGDTPGFGDGDGGSGTPTNLEGRDPVDCAEAASTHSYVGCDYWPTITPNPVSSTFKFVAAVANTGKSDATVNVTGPNGFTKTVTVPAGELAKVELPWISALKGPDSNGATPPTAALVEGGAYHLVSSTPVIVYQFNPLEFQSGGAYSLTNDASLLLPSTAMTGNYRVAGMHASDAPKMPAVLTITATKPNTNVKLKLSKTAEMAAAGPIAAASGGSLVDFTLKNAGDVVQLLTKESTSAQDFSGSVIQASAPVQVITSIPCIYLPKDKAACDHIEETVPPAETLGKKYVIAPPTGDDGKVAGQVVRIFGNQDGTKLTYSPSKPSGCPDTLNAGQVADCGIVKDAFVIEGTNEFAIQSYLLGAQYNHPGFFDMFTNNKGDPSQTTYPAVEQFRKNYIFLAPTTYPVLWADVTAPQGTTLTLDGAPVTAKWEQIGSSNYGIYRLDLTKGGKDGVHKLESQEPVGVQVLGYGSNTTFQYPAGLNLSIIAKPPTVN